MTSSISRSTCRRCSRCCTSSSAATPAGLSESAAPVLSLLLDSLREARRYVDKVAAMGGVERFVRSGAICEELARVRQGLRDALLNLQAVAVQISGGTSAMVQHLLARLSSWQVAQEQGVDAVAEMLSQHSRTALQGHARVEGKLDALIERLCTGLPQLVQEIDSTLQQPGLSDAQDQASGLLFSSSTGASHLMTFTELVVWPPMPWQVLRAMRQACQGQQEQLQRFWVDPAAVQVHELLGQGSSGQVYRGTVKGRPAAIKLLALPASEGNAVATAGSLAGLLHSNDRVSAALRRELCVMAQSHQFDNTCRWAGYWCCILRVVFALSHS